MLVRHPILGVIKMAFLRIARSWQYRIGWDRVSPTQNILHFVSALSPEQDIELVASSLLCIEPQDFPIPPLSRWRCTLPENSFHDTLIENDLTKGTEVHHSPAQLLEDDPEVSSSQQENIKRFTYSDVKRQKVE